MIHSRAELRQTPVAVGEAIAPADFRAMLRTDFTAALLDVVDRIDLGPFLVGKARDQIDLHAFFAAHPEVRTSCAGKLNRFLEDILDETSPRLLRLERSRCHTTHSDLH